VTVLATHGVFSKNALKILESYGDFVRAVVVTNSISQTENVEKGRLKNKFHVLDVSGEIFPS
jgi:phosphoribosylpyrophosphate synthetase